MKWIADSDIRCEMPLETDLTESNRESVCAVETIEPGGVKELYQVDPIRDPRWPEFLQRHPRASVFHTPAWLEALRRTYGYEPIGYTSSPPGQEIRNGLVFCRINSWLMGRRMVSLPFSDHCEPFFSSAEELEFFIRRLQGEVKPQKWNYLEVRPLSGIFDLIGQESGFRPAKRYHLHSIDLRPDLDQILRGFDKDSVVRRIRRAERAGLIEKCGTSVDLLEDFYNLLVLTRGRHDLPPQPYEWFQNLIDCLGDALAIRIAYKEETPVAAILTLRFRDVVLYKYGCSDARFKNLAGMPLLLWRAIEEAKAAGAREFSLGRSDEDNVGLVAFKNHWTPLATSLVYWRYPGPASLETRESWRVSMAKRVFALMPQSLLTKTGKFIYRHIG
jgi:lipid II:glycine glycyltransferase (peptidoglycan interpeptide bridge formation enzyme)